MYGSFAAHLVDLIVSISCWFPELMTRSSSIWTLLLWPNRYYGKLYQIRQPSYIDINIHSSYFLTVHIYIYLHCIQILYIIKRCGHLTPTHQIFVCCLLRASGIINNIPQNITSYWFKWIQPFLFLFINYLTLVSSPYTTHLKY